VKEEAAAAAAAKEAETLRRLQQIAATLDTLPDDGISIAEAPAPSEPAPVAKTEAEVKEEAAAAAAAKEAETLRRLQQIAATLDTLPDDDITPSQASLTSNAPPVAHFIHPLDGLITPSAVLFPAPPPPPPPPPPHPKPPPSLLASAPMTAIAPPPAATALAPLSDSSQHRAFTPAAAMPVTPVRPPHTAAATPETGPDVTISIDAFDAPAPAQVAASTPTLAVCSSGTAQGRISTPSSPVGFAYLSSDHLGAAPTTLTVSTDRELSEAASETSESTGATAAAATAKAAASAAGKELPDLVEDASPGPSASTPQMDYRHETKTDLKSPPTDRSATAPLGEALVALQEAPQQTLAQAPPESFSALSSLTFGFSSSALYSMEAKAAEERSRSAPRKGPRPIQMPRL
jgi:hypothetical protein